MRPNPVCASRAAAAPRWPCHTASQVRADYRFIDTYTYSLPFTLRFPRIKRVRYDKSFIECMSDREVNDMHESSKHDPLMHTEFTTANMLRCNAKVPSKKRTGSSLQVPPRRVSLCHRVLTLLQVAGSFRRLDVDCSEVGQVPADLFEGIEASVLGEDDARAETTKLLKAGGAKLMLSKNTLDDGVRLFSCDTTNARFRRYAALHVPERPDVMHSRWRTMHGCMCVPSSPWFAVTSQSASQRSRCWQRSPSISS